MSRARQGSSPRETYTMVISRHFGGGQEVEYLVTYDADTHEAINEVEL